MKSYVKTRVVFNLLLYFFVRTPCSSLRLSGPSGSASYGGQASFLKDILFVPNQLDWLF